MSVLALVSSVSAFIKLKVNYEKVVIDNFAFKLHYRFTAAILFLCCIFCSAYSFFGEPIYCISSNPDDAGKLKPMTTYCWIHTTFSLPTEKKNGEAANGSGNENHYDTKTIHSYYQWVPFALFLQGVMFYFPHWAWKNCERGTIGRLTDGLRGTTIQTPESYKEQLTSIADYISSSGSHHTLYGIQFIVCQALNFIIVVSNIFLIDIFLGHAFLTYGSDVLSFAGQQDRVDAMEKVFPKVTKCTFNIYGKSGGLQLLDLMCVLSLNVVNEKIYIFLWFWLLILASISGLSLIYNTVLILSPKCREMAIRYFHKFSPRNDLRSFLQKMEAGDFVLVYLLGQNMHSKLFTELMDILCDTNGKTSKFL